MFDDWVDWYYILWWPVHHTNYQISSSRGSISKACLRTTLADALQLVKSMSQTGTIASKFSSRSTLLSVNSIVSILTSLSSSALTRCTRKKETITEATRSSSAASLCTWHPIQFSGLFAGQAELCFAHFQQIREILKISSPFQAVCLAFDFPNNFRWVSDKQILLEPNR